MRYEILGPLQVVGADGKTFFMARKIEIVLAALLIRAGQVVPAQVLMNEIWGDEPPRRATAGLHVYVSQLRKLLAAAGGGQNTLVTRASGYLINVDPDELDTHLFRRLAAHGREYAKGQE